MIFLPPGVSDDEIDRLHLERSFENPARWEDTLKSAYIDAKTDPALSEVLKGAFLQEDRADAFRSFVGSDQAAAMAQFIQRFGLTPSSAICDLGCGPGHFAHALRQFGFGNLTAMDPNGERNSGTGYLREISGGAVDIINSLDEWRTISCRFDAIVSSGTIHHWQHIPLVAIDARRAMKPGAFWFAFGEYFASTPHEFAQAITQHPTASRYGSYEWAYPPSVYVDMIQSVGFNLVAVIPYFYESNRLTGSMSEAPPDIDIAELNKIVDEGLVASGGTVEQFWEEVDLFRRQRHGNRVFTRPQVMVFQRVASA